MLDEWLNASKPRLAKVGLNKFLKLVEEGKASIAPKDVIDAIYRDLRNCSYPLSPRNKIDIDTITAQDTNQVEVQPQNNWHYRKPKNRAAMGWSTSGETVGRISLNVHAEPELIQKLDEFCTKHKVYYKTPNQIAAWEERHDPITMYFHEPISAGIQNELKQIVAPHVRGHDLHGHTIANGICMEASPSVKDIHILIERAGRLDPRLAEAVREKAYDATKPQAEPKLSAGQKRAIEIALDDYMGFKAKAVTKDIVAMASRPEFSTNIFTDTKATDISTYQGTNGTMLRMVIRDTPDNLEAATKRLEEQGLKPGDDFSNRTGTQIIVMGSKAQGFIESVCNARGVNPAILTGRSSLIR